MATIKKYNGSTWENTTARKYETKSEIITPPTTIYTDGTAITSYTIKGNTVQNGTPTPTNPVMPQGTGERTENLFDKSTVKNGYYINDTNGKMESVASDALNASDYIYIGGASNLYIGYQLTNRWGAFYDNAKVYVSGINGYGNTVIPPNAVYARITVRSDNLDNLMLNLGSTPLPYEPYGYKIPISNGDVTTNIYLNEPLHKIGNYADTIESDGTVTRKIKKIILTGSETDWSVIHSGTANQYFMLPVLKAIQGNELCTHFIKNGVYDGNTNVGIIVIGDGAIRIRPENVATISLTDFKTWLVTQYDNGTPVTVWYVLETAETETVTAPSIPTTEGANSITVDTTVQPSEFTATWTGWHNASVKEWDGSQWNE